MNDEDLNELIANIKEPVFWRFPHEICVIERPMLLEGVQKRMRIVISQTGDNTVYLQSRNGVLGWGFGASDVPVICGVGYNAEPKHFWEYLLYMKHEWSEGNDLTRHGNHFEGLVRCVYELMSGFICHAGNMWRCNVEWLAEGLKASGAGSYCSWEIHSCSPDAVVLHKSTIASTTLPCIDKIQFAVEFKAPYGRLYDDIPIYYLMQVAWQMYTLMVPYVDFFAARIGHIGDEDEGVVHEVLWIRVHWSTPLIERMLTYVNQFTQCLYSKEEPTWKHGRDEGEKEWRALSHTELIYRGNCPSDVAQGIAEYWSKNKNDREW